MSKQIEYYPEFISSEGCVICGKELGDADNAKHVEMRISTGNLVLHGTVELEDSQGTFPVGPACYRNLMTKVKEELAK